MNFGRRKSYFMNRTEDSFIVSDSEEEEYSPQKKNATAANIQVINDSDSEGDASQKADSNPNVSEDESKSETLDSEEEDLRFMNNSHMVSIVDHSSDSESNSSEEEETLNKLKRRSIYDNPVRSCTPKSESTPLHGIKRKRIRKAVIHSDSESENLSVDDREKSTNKSQSKVLQYSLDEKSNKIESKESNEFFDRNDVVQSIESSDESSSNYQDLNAQSRDNNDSKSNNINTSKMKHNLLEKSILKDKNTFNIDVNKKNNSIDEKKPFTNYNINDFSKHDQSQLCSGEKSYNTDKNTKIVDLTVDQSFENAIDIENKKAMKINQESSDEVVICSSTSTSETEIDDEVMNFVKKEIGVGNIDPVEAQKREHYMLQIDMLQKQLDKLHKFAESVDVAKLPDRGAKVHQRIKSDEQKLMDLQAKLSKLSRKSTIDNRQNSELPKLNTQPKINVKASRSSYDSSNEDKENYDGREKFNKHNFVDDKSEESYEKDDFDVRDIPNVPQTSFDANELGKKALETLNKQQSLTAQRLEQLHGSLTSRPAEDARDKDPYGLKIQLMPHQQHALAWMKWREKQKPKGGILADDMGLGKTLTMISLVLANLNEQDSDSNDSSSDEEWFSKKKHKRYYGGTLVVCPASLIKQWESEVKNRCKRGLLTVLVFHGNKRNIDDRKISKFNIVVTTYQTLVREAELESGMYKMEWNRVILDEAHYIRNHKSKACLAVCGLNAKHRWALTGTPIQNKEMDLYAILKFLNCSPFNDIQVWKRWVDNKNDAGKQRLVTIMKTMMLRRTKQELQSKGSLDSLPDKFIDIIEIEMDRDETLAYQKILLFSQNLFAQFLAQRADKQHVKELYGGKFDKPSSYGAVTQFTKAQKVLLAHHSNIESYEILVLLLRLRQMCCHPALVHAMLDKEDAEVNGIIEDDNANSALLKRLNDMSINEEGGEVDEHAANYKIDEKVATNLLTKKNPVFDENRHSSKVRRIIETVEEILEKGDKLIIVSQWSSFLKVVAKNLRDVEDARYEFFTGEVAVKNRQAIVDKLNNPRESTNILLLSLTAGGVGLNLVGANHLLLIDIHWNPQLEAQAQDRIYRFGQKKNVHVYKFICKETIEERVKALQDKKLDIANHVLTGTRSVSSKLTIEDLKMLFS